MEKTELLTDWQYGKINCIANYERQIYVGTQDGWLIFLELSFKLSQFGGEEKYSLTEKVKKKINEKDPILSIQFDQAFNIGFVLCNKMIQVFDLNSLEIKKQLIDSTQGAVHLCVNKNFVSHQFLICVKKKIKIINYTNMLEFSNVSEFDSPSHPIEKIEWINKTVAIYSKKKLFFFNSSNGEIEIDKNNFSCNSLLNDDFSKLGALTKVFGLNENNINFQNSFKWSEQPIAVGICFPHIVGIISKGIEIYNLYEKTIEKDYKIKNVVSISDDTKRLYLGGKNSIWILTPLPADKQVSQMIKNLKIDQAFNLFQRAYDGSKKEKDIILQKMNEEAGFSLFFSEQYKQSLTHFKAANTNIQELLSIFPELLPPKWNYKPKIDRNLKNEIIENLKRNKIEVKESKVESSMNRAKKILIEYLDEIRPELLNNYYGLVQSSLAASASAKSVRQSFEKNIADLKKIQICVDYCLVNAYLKDNNHTKDLKVLLRGENFCEVEHLEPLLKKSPKFLSFLLWSKGQHQKALELLYSIGSEQKKNEEDKILNDNNNIIDKKIERVVNPKNNGFEETIELLSECTKPDLVFKYSEWCFDYDDKKSITIFTSKKRPEKEQLSPKDVLKFLSGFPQDLEIQYLEFLVKDLKIKEPEFHTKLAIGYVKLILKIKNSEILPYELRLNSGKESGLLGGMRKKLIDLLSVPATECYIDLQKFIEFLNSLSDFKSPSTHDFWEEMVLSYRLLKLHKESLKTLIFKMNDFDWTEKYCIEIFEEDSFISKIKEDRIYRKLRKERMKLKEGTSSSNLSGRFQSEEETDNIVLKYVPEEEKKKFFIREDELNPLFITLIDVCVNYKKSKKEDIYFFDQKKGNENKKDASMNSIQVENLNIFKKNSSNEESNENETSEIEDPEKKIFFDYVLYILSKHAKRIDPIKTIELLPNDFALKDLFSYHKQILQCGQNRYKNKKVLKNAANMNYLYKRATLAKLTSRCITIKSTTKCPICNKTIGTSVFCVFPDLVVAHLKCVEKNKLHIQPLNFVNFQNFPLNVNDFVTDEMVLNPKKLYDI